MSQISRKIDPFSVKLHVLHSGKDRVYTNLGLGFAVQPMHAKFAYV